ncbi:hypothetical protein [Hoeflea marina]|uniref:hypothetical protein n=1 Tax=Hoeflea marina TaxID=274592 RepID=UPI001304835F|nr:hypothetical protein [Hoeflea marina]
MIVLQGAAKADDLTDQTTNIIRICAPSENLRLRLSGEVGGFIAKRLMGAQADGDGELFRDGEILGRMIELSPADSKEIYKMYLDCVKPQVDRFVEAHPVEGARTIMPGESFGLSYGSSVSLLSGEYHFAVGGVRFNRDKKTVWKVRTTLTGGGRTAQRQLELSEHVWFPDKSCRVVYTGVNQDSTVFRFRLQCS